MITTATTAEEYLASLPPDRALAIAQLRDCARRALLPGFEENTGYVGINYVVPLSRFPDGYHCTPGEPLPFITIASQARHIAFYHMGLYADPVLLEWFTEAWKSQAIGRLDMGKSCIRFGNPSKIPYTLLEDLMTRMDVERWIALYQLSRVEAKAAKRTKEGK